MRKQIEEAIRTTLVVENKESIHYAVDKILLLFGVSGRSEQFACLCPRTKYDDCDRDMPCKECEGCKHFRQANCH